MALASELPEIGGDSRQCTISRASVATARIAAENVDKAHYCSEIPLPMERATRVEV